jgi:hypothetical protein
VASGAADAAGLAQTTRADDAAGASPVGLSRLRAAAATGDQSEDHRRRRAKNAHRQPRLGETYGH